jgi:hypothetical protein
MIYIRKIKIGILVGLFIVLCQTISPALAYWVDGEVLLNWCSSKPTDPHYIECIGYIQGHMDTALIGGALEQRFICLPDDITLGHVGEIAVKYLNSHADTKQKAAPFALLDALHDVYPCKSGK